MTVTARRQGRPRSEHADQAIIDATVELVAEFGYRGLTVEAVAARAGVAKTTVYRRWGSKEELVFGVMARLSGPTAVPRGEDVREDLLILLERVREQWTSGPHGRLMHRLSAEGHEQPALYREFRDRLLAPRQRVMQGVLQRAVAEGLIKPDADLDWIGQLLVSPIVAAAFTHRSLPDRDQLRDLIELVLTGRSNCCGSTVDLPPQLRGSRT